MLTPATNAVVAENAVADSLSLTINMDVVASSLPFDQQASFHSILLTVGNLGPDQTLDIDSFQFGWGLNNAQANNSVFMDTFSSVTGFELGLELAGFVAPGGDTNPATNVISANVSNAGFSGLVNGNTVEFRIYFRDGSGLDGRQHLLDGIQIATTVNGDPPPASEPATGLDLLGVFTPSSVAPMGNFTLTTTEDLDLSGSTWGTGVFEEPVYQASLRHQQAGHDWQVRIGRGGHIYSIIDSVLGELVPPQRSHSPFVDEVFQTVSAISRLTQLAADPDTVFYHQSGYFGFGIRGDDPTNPHNLPQPTYSPLLANGSVEDDSYSTLTLSVQADPRRVPQVPSKMLMYQRTRSLGDGVIEVTNSIYNFGDMPIGFHNMPWGGVRRSKLDYMLVADLLGGYSNRIVDNFRNTADQLDSILDTGGWAAWAENDATQVNPSSVRAIGFAFGNTQPHIDEPWQNRAGQWRWGQGGDDERDFNIVTLRQGIGIGPGDLFESRYFMVLGDVDHIESTINNRGLVNAATYNMIRIAEQDSPPTLNYQIQTGVNGEVLVQPVDASASHDFKTYAHPVQGSVPLFLMADFYGNQFLSVDPYAFSDFPYNRITNYDGILGFVLPGDIATGDGPYVDLDTLFPAGLYVNTDPGTTIMALKGAVLGDFDCDSSIDLVDLDQYNGNIGAEAVGDLAALDLNGSGTVDADDLVQHYSTLVETSNGQTGTFAGDANLDGMVDVLGDAFTLISNLGSPANSWSQGDFNADEMVDVLGDAFALIANLGRSNL